MSIDYLTFSNLIIDDIVFSDGRSAMNILGGSGTHAVIGMRVWNDKLGFAASVGADLDQGHNERLTKFGVDCGGLVVREGYQTARAWQIFEPDDLRIEIFRTDMKDFNLHRVTFDDLPAAYRQAKGYHLNWGTLAEFEALIDAIRAENQHATLLMEATPSQVKESAETFQRILPQIDFFAPDREEAEQMTGISDPAQICDVLLEWGAPMVAIRMGKRGSLLKTSTGEGWQLPAVPTNIVDVTGAGNAYCGGVLTGLGDGESPLEVGLRGVVSASFAIEQLGMPSWFAPPQDEISRRLTWAREQVKSL